MYRENDRTPKAPTRIEYRSRIVRPGSFVLAFFLTLFALGIFAGMHATHMVCARANDEGSCHVRRYGLIRSLQVDLPIDEIASLDVVVRTGSKGSKYAEVRLATTPESGHGVIDLETGAWGHVDPAKAMEARSSFSAFKQGRIGSFDAWLTLGPGTNILMSLVSLMFGFIGVAILREQIGQLRPIRLVVDHQREVVILRGREIPFREIDAVTVEDGRALFWSSRKNEHIPGHRLLVVRRKGDSVAATREFRAGARNEHEQARKTLLRALGRDVT
jgi:uncharacterized protein (UPF0248 family)